MLLYNLLENGVYIGLIPLSLNLPLPASSATSRELLSQFSTCSGRNEMNRASGHLYLFLSNNRDREPNPEP